MIPFILSSRKCKLISNDGWEINDCLEMELGRDRTGRTGGRNYKGDEEIWGDKDMFIIVVVMVSQMYIYLKICQIAHFKYVQFIICQLHLGKTIKRKIKIKFIQDKKCMT